MGLQDNTEDKLHEKHQELCDKLNLPQSTVTEAWESFNSIRTNFTLEGDPLHSLGCAIFISCRKSNTPTVGRSVVQGGFVNLTSLLRFCNLSLAQFFNKIKQWALMANVSNEFKQGINSLEENFAVSCNIFKDYVPIFCMIFVSPQESGHTKQYRNRKNKTGPCTPSKLFEFIWNLFVTFKSESNSNCQDLVTSYHLLFACCDFVFKNALLADKRDLLNASFSGLPENWSQSDYVIPKEVPCIIDILLGNNISMSTEAKYIKQYSFRNFIKKMFNDNVLQGDKDLFCGILDSTVFIQNFRNISEMYEHQLLKKGDFDERIFLAEYRRRLLLKEHTVSRQQNNISGKSDGSNLVESPKNKCDETVRKPSNTPLTGQKYLSPKEPSERNSTFNSNQNIAKLQASLLGRNASPSEGLLKIFSSCSNDPTEKVQNIVSELSTKFTLNYTNELESSNSTEYTNKLLQISVTLFYQLIEKILQNEKTINSDISVLVEKNIFYECVFTCSLEIVLYTYNDRKVFPWILKAISVQPFDFVRIIELIVRSKDHLSRDLVKHLNWVEETILESLLWKSDSSLWKHIELSEDKIPKFEEIALPGNLVYTEQMQQDCNELKAANEPENSDSFLSSPNPSAVDRFQSPIENSVKKQLFTKQLKTSIHLGDGMKATETGLVQDIPTKPKKTGSLPIVFRKFYNLAGVRMDHLCNLLNITSIELQCKIWTVFEHAVRFKTELMRDRHLDQLLMCCVYVICKVTENCEKNFTEIMRCYREQPQADSHIYRDVLLTRSTTKQDGTIVPEERSDLICFYNSVFVVYLKNFALKFATNKNQNSNSILLSPLPAPKSQLVSPRLQVVKNVFVKQHESPNTSNMNSKALHYYFNRSPSKDLKDINKAINNSASVNVNGKRLLIDSDVDYQNKRIPNKKMQSLLEQRRSQNID